MKLNSLIDYTWVIIAGIPLVRVPFTPLVPGAVKVPNTCWYRAPEHLQDDEEQFGVWAADRIEEAINFEGIVLSALIESSLHSNDVYRSRVYCRGFP